MEKARADKIRHIMKRISGITAVFNAEVDALNIELTELLEEDKKEETKNGQN